MAFKCDVERKRDTTDGWTSPIHTGTLRNVYSRHRVECREVAAEEVLEGAPFPRHPVEEEWKSLSLDARSELRVWLLFVWRGSLDDIDFAVLDPYADAHEFWDHTDIDERESWVCGTTAPISSIS